MVEGELQLKPLPLGLLPGTAAGVSEELRREGKAALEEFFCGSDYRARETSQPRAVFTAKSLVNIKSMQHAVERKGN